VDIIIRFGDGIVLIKRKYPPFGWAIPGGFVEYGETVEEAARREAKEETSLELISLEQFRVYSSPDRDPRAHTVSVVFAAQGKGRLKAGDDASSIGVFNRENLPDDIAFDHKFILRDYFEMEEERRKNFLKEIEGSSSPKSFFTKEISQESMDFLIDSITSVIPKMPTLFFSVILIRDKEKKQKILETLQAKSLSGCSLLAIFLLELDRAKYFNRKEKLRRGELILKAVVDATVSAVSLLIASTQVGLSGSLIEVKETERIKKFLSIKGDKVPFLCLSLGFLKDKGEIFSLPPSLLVHKESYDSRKIEKIVEFLQKSQKIKDYCSIIEDFLQVKWNELLRS